MTLRVTLRAAPAWTPEEDSRLRRLFGHVTHGRLTVTLQRPVSEIVARAKKLGITRRGERARPALN